MTEFEYCEDKLFLFHLPDFKEKSFILNGRKFLLFEHFLSFVSYLHCVQYVYVLNERTLVYC